MKGILSYNSRFSYKVPLAYKIIKTIHKHATHFKRGPRVVKPKTLSRKSIEYLVEFELEYEA